ncbi:MAG: BatA domain-containing protein [Verrucomicrobiota bacterium]
MNFVQPAFLAALGALGIPLIIHFLHSRKLTPLDLGTLRFVREAVSETTRWQRLRDWLLLLLRLLLVALAALLFARPFRENSSNGAQNRKAGEEWILVLDASASMRFRKPGDTLPPGAAPPNAAAGIFAARLKEVPEGVRAVPVLLAESVREITSADSAASAAGGPCDFAALVKWLASRAAAEPSVSRRVLLFTDLQQPVAALPADAPWPDGVPLEIVSVLPPATGNLSLAAPARRVQPFIPGRETTLLLPVVRSGAVVPRKLTAQAGQGREWQKLELREYPAEALEIELKLSPPGPGELEAVAHLRSQDPWPLDDRCDLSLKFTGRLPVLLVDGDPDGGGGARTDGFTAPADSAFAAETYYLNQALLTPDRGQTISGFEVTVSQGPVEKAPVRAWRAIALCNPAALSPAGISVLSAQVKAGAGLLLFPGDHMDRAAWDRLTAAGLCPAAVEPPDAGAVAVPRPILTWDTAHPALSVFAAREEGDLSRLILSDRLRITPSAGAVVPAAMDGARPALVAGTLGKGRVLLFANPVDRAWSDLPRERLFLPLMHALFGYAAGTGAGAASEEGLPAVRDVTLADNRLPGRHDGVILRVPADESTAPFLDETNFRAALRLEAAAAALESPASAKSGDWRKVPGASRPDEWWPLLAVGLLVFLLGETLLADHQPPSAPGAKAKLKVKTKAKAKARPVLNS